MVFGLPVRVFNVLFHAAHLDSPHLDSGKILGKIGRYPSVSKSKPVIC